MSWKFQLLNIERNTQIDCDKEENYKMPKRRYRKTSQQKKFSKAVNKCHNKTKNPKSFGNCMHKELKK